MPHWIIPTAVAVASSTALAPSWPGLSHAHQDRRMGGKSFVWRHCSHTVMAGRVPICIRISAGRSVILPLPLREGAGGGGGTSTNRGRGIGGRLDFGALPPPPNPLPQGEREDFSPAWPLS